jgi:hypothetical protein
MDGNASNLELLSEQIEVSMLFYEAVIKPTSQTIYRYRWVDFRIFIIAM